jgi:RNA methyltransferase, TrmH family
MNIKTMISKNKIKYIHSLESKKNRDKEDVFVAEGPKVVEDIMALRKPKLIVATAQWLQHNNKAIPSDCEIIEVNDEELAKASFMQHPQQVLAIFDKDKNELGTEDFSDKLALVLDGVQDPGNLGTIIRIADWFGITNVVCSRDTADIYNPKVVQSTMGSIARVKTFYTDLKEFITSLPAETPIYGTLLEGDNIYSQELERNGLIVVGNEGKGISPEIRKLINRRIRIPNYPPGRETADSLNVAVATGIVCAEFRRRG